MSPLLYRLSYRAAIDAAIGRDASSRGRSRSAGASGTLPRRCSRSPASSARARARSGQTIALLLTFLGHRRDRQRADRLHRRPGAGRAQGEPGAPRRARDAVGAGAVAGRCSAPKCVKDAGGRRRIRRLPMKQSAAPTATPAPPHGHQALSAYIRARFDEFSRSQKDVAQYIVDHLDEAAFQTAEELARRASTSSSTVVRFSQALGFEGFPELQQAARDEYRRRPPGLANGVRRRGRAAVLARSHRVRGRAGRRPRERRGHRAQALARPTSRRRSTRSCPPARC